MQPRSQTCHIPEQKSKRAIRGLAEAFVEAERLDKWSWIADKFYHENCVYTCPYAGAMVGGRERPRGNSPHALRARHGRGSGWKGWSFPIIGWGSRGPDHQPLGQPRPGKRPDGSYYETHGVSFITYGGEGKFTSQYDLFDFAHQMRLCDELEEAGLLDPKLKQELGAAEQEAADRHAQQGDAEMSDALSSRRARSWWSAAAAASAAVCLEFAKAGTDVALTYHKNGRSSRRGRGAEIKRARPQGDRAPAHDR